MCQRPQVARPKSHLNVRPRPIRHLSLSPSRVAGTLPPGRLAPPSSFGVIWACDAHCANDHWRLDLVHFTVDLVMPQARSRCFEPMFAAYPSVKSSDSRSFSCVAVAKVARRRCRRTRASTGAGTARQARHALQRARGLCWPTRAGAHDGLLCAAGRWCGGESGRCDCPIEAAGPLQPQVV